MRITRSPLLHSFIHSAGLSAIGAALAFLILGKPRDVADLLFFLWAAFALLLTAKSALERWLYARHVAKLEMDNAVGVCIAKMAAAGVSYDRREEILREAYSSSNTPEGRNKRLLELTEKEIREARQRRAPDYV